MFDYDIYVSALCLITYVMFVTISIFCIAVITRLSIRLIRSGAEDERILRDYERNQKFEKVNDFAKNIIYLFSSVVFIGLMLVFVFSLIVQHNGDVPLNEYLPVYRVVQTGSMSEKHKNNTYLVENNLNDQFQAFDVIKTKMLPDEMDLELFDVVVYEYEGILIVHRIVGIEEPNEKHPDKRYFLLQGDAVKNPDQFPVYYSQMRGIYRGKRVPFVGSFITFMQSPAGYLCMILILFAFIATPIMEKKIDKEMQKRLALLEKEKACGSGANGQAGKQPQVYAAYMPAYYFAGYYVMPTVAQQPQRQNNEQTKKKKK